MFVCQPTPYQVSEFVTTLSIGGSKGYFPGKSWIRHCYDQTLLDLSGILGEIDDIQSLHAQYEQPGMEFNTISFKKFLVISACWVSRTGITRHANNCSPLYNEEIPKVVSIVRTSNT